MSLMDSDLQNQLSDERRKVDFDTYDITVDELTRRIQAGRIEIAPVYQRKFRWKIGQKSRLIESLLLGLPIPPIFMAHNDSPHGQTWEVVDGAQRLNTLLTFTYASEELSSFRLEELSSFRLQELSILSNFNNLSFSELPKNIQEHLLNRPLKTVVLNDKSEWKVRLDLFERINTGGLNLTKQEIREAVFNGEFTNLLNELSSSEQFKQAVHIPKTRENDRYPNELVLRFFALLDGYQNFNHSVIDFLNEYMKKVSVLPIKILIKKNVYLMLLLKY